MYTYSYKCIHTHINVYIYNIHVGRGKHEMVNAAGKCLKAGELLKSLSANIKPKKNEDEGVFTFIKKVMTLLLLCYTILYCM